MHEQRQDIGFLIKRINDSIGKYGNEQMRESGMTFSQMRVITYLKEHQGEKRAQKDIEEFFGVSHPTVVGIIQRLEERGLLRSAIDSDDRRIKNLSLTKQGEALIASVEKQRAKMDEMLVKGLNADEVEQLRALLTRVVENAQ